MVFLLNFLMFFPQNSKCFIGSEYSISTALGLVFAGKMLEVSLQKLFHLWRYYMTMRSYGDLWSSECI